MKKLVSYKGLVIFAAILIAVVLFFGILLPVFLSAKTVSPKTLQLSNIKQLGTAILLYLGDHDEHYPAASSMPSTRALLMPYIKRKEMFIPIEGYATHPAFNFNLAGVSSDLPPFPHSKAVEPDAVIMWHSYILQEPYGYIVARADGSGKTMKESQFEEFHQMLAPQFDRKGVKLFPPDYLADQDPLKK